MRQSMEEILKFATCKCIDKESLESIAQITRELIRLDDEEKSKIQFTRCKNLDCNGNPRYICHFLSLVTREEMEAFHKVYGLKAISQAYIFACKRANKISGRKHHNKSYGGGIVFQSYSLDELEKDIKELIANDKKFTA